VKDHTKFVITLAGVLVLLAGCGRESIPAVSDQKIYAVNGRVQELEPDGRTVVVQHEAISNYMAAMTMPFEVHDSNQLSGLKAGDAITFHLVITSKEGWIEDVKKRPKPVALASPGIHLSHAVAGLKIGETVPDYHFTNELGRVVSLAQYRGRVVALTFFFTTCPYPNFCPRMTSNFSEAEAKLKARKDMANRWQLFSISFDPRTDTPPRLRAYAEKAHYDPGHWSFLTGDLAQITGLADEFGETFTTQGPTITHNLRTVVIDPQGRVRKIYEGNAWTPAELVAEMAKVRGPRPKT
jgi:protein SCO1/2